MNMSFHSLEWKLSLWFPLTECTEKQSAKGVAGIHCKSISTFDLLENTSVPFSSRSSFLSFLSRKDPQAYNSACPTAAQIPRKLFSVMTRYHYNTKPLTHIMKPLTKPLLKKNCSVQCWHFCPAHTMCFEYDVHPHLVWVRSHVKFYLLKRDFAPCCDSRKRHLHFFKHTADATVVIGGPLWDIQVQAVLIHRS